MRREGRREDGDAARFLPGELSFVSLLVVRLVFSMKPFDFVSHSTTPLEPLSVASHGGR